MSEFFRISEFTIFVVIVEINLKKKEFLYCIIYLKSPNYEKYVLTLRVRSTQPATGRFSGIFFPVTVVCPRTRHLSTCTFQARLGRYKQKKKLPTQRSFDHRVIKRYNNKHRRGIISTDGEKCFDEITNETLTPFTNVLAEQVILI